MSQLRIIENITEKEKKGKMIEIDNILLEDSLSLWIQVSYNKFLFCINVNIMKS